MNFNNCNYNKATFQADIKRKQAMFNRMRRRYNCTNDTQERRWLKTEATRIITELQTYRRRWTNWNFGPCNWITKNYTTTYFTCAAYPTTRRNITRKTTINRTCARKSYSNYGTTYRSSRIHRPSRTRTHAHRSTYTAW